MKGNKIFFGKSYIRKETIMYILFVIAILIMRLWNISDLNGPILFDDEIGYWSHAANLAGLSWTEVVHSWYSYGYSILLMPLFWITHNMKILYRIAIVLNALMGAVAFALGKAIIQEIDEQCDEITSMVISFTAVCYSAYIFQSNIAWSETFVYTWFMLIVWSAIKFFKRRTRVNTILFTVECSFLYIIHNRCIVIFIAYAIVLCYMVIKRKIDWKKVVMAFAIIAGIMSLNIIIKARLSEMVWETSNGFTGNNLATHSSKVNLLFYLDGLKALLCSLFGKLWYLLTSTLMLAYFGGSYIVKRFISGIQAQKKNETDDTYLFFLFLILFICGTIAVATIVMIPGAVDYTQKTRLDVYFYGRYSEIVSGVLILFGLVDIMHKARRKWRLTECAVGLILYLACGGILYLQIRDVVDFFLNTPCVPGIYFTRNFSCIKYSGIVLTLYLVGSIVYCLTDDWGKQIHKVKIGIVSLTVVIIFVYISQNVYSLYVQISQEYNDQVNEICEILNKNSHYPIYCPEISVNIIRQTIRSRVVEGNIKYDLPAEPDDNFFIVEDIGTTLDVDSIGKDMYYVVSGANVMLLAIGDELVEEIQQEGYLCCHMAKEVVNMLDVRMDLFDREYDKEIKFGEDLSVTISLQDDLQDMASFASFRLSYHVYDAAGNLIIWEGDRYAIGGVLSEIPVTIAANNFVAAGEYVVEFDLVEDGVAWLSEIGGETIRLHVTVE